MNEAEALEVAGIYMGNALAAFTLYVTFTMAYLVAAYFTGDRLTTFQTLTASILFLFTAVIVTVAVINNTLILSAALETTELSAVTPFLGGQIWAITMAAIMTAGIIVSLYFMWSVRHPKTE
jgi:hypothetical protein